MSTRTILVALVASLALPHVVDARASTALVLDELADLGKKLKDPSEKERRSAVQALAKLGSKDAWELVVDALKDASPMVADEAQLQLGALRERELLIALVEKKGLGASDPWVARRAAEAFGRMDGRVDVATASAVIAAQKDAETRRMLAWSIERTAGKGAKDALTVTTASKALAHAVEGDKDAGVRAAALLAATAVDPSASRALVDAAVKDKAPELRCAALAAMRERPAIERFDAAKALASDPAYAVRAQAIETLASCGTKQAATLLVDRLEQEKSLRLRWRVVDALQRLSGSDLELNVPYWRKWVAGLDDAWAPATGEKKAPREVKQEGTTVFLGLPVLSERVAILVDFSGSLWQKRADGKTRKEVVDEELARLLKQLAPSTKFNVVPYTATPIAWEKTLQPADKASVARALDFFVKCKATGKGNVWDAIELALDDPEVDTIVVLTDGAPTGGHRWNLELMESLLAERVRFRKVAVDAILVDAGKFLQDRWRAITAATGGRMQSVEMK